MYRSDRFKSKNLQEVLNEMKTIREVRVENKRKKFVTALTGEQSVNKLRMIRRNIMKKRIGKKEFVLCLLVLAGVFLMSKGAEAAKPKVSPSQVILSVGNTKTLKMNNSKNKVLWTSNNKSVAHVSSKGVVTARKKGAATITAKVFGKEYQYKVKVTDAKLNVSQCTIPLNAEKQLKFKTYSGKGVVWKSDNIKVATVTKNGIVKGINPGTAVISAKLQSSTYKCKVTVMLVNEKEEEEERPENSEDVIASRNWASIMDFPSEQEITDFNKTSVNRSPYLSGWLDIGKETKFIEYSIDFKADYIPYGTYLNCANMKMDLSSLEQEYDEVYMDYWLSFYAGLQMWEPAKGSGSIMSFWDIYCKDKAGEISTIRAKLVYPENREANVFGHEGNGVNYMDDYAWERGHWYRMLLRCCKSEENGHTLVEQLICNLETGKWTKMCCYDTGLTDSCFVGDTAIFLENYLTEYAGDIRTAEYKNIRIRLKDTGQWIPIKQVTINDNDYPGSFCFGADDEQFWMITTGLQNRAIQQCGKKGTFKVTACEDGSPY